MRNGAQHGGSGRVQVGPAKASGDRPCVMPRTVMSMASASCECTWSLASLATWRSSRASTAPSAASASSSVGSVSPQNESPQSVPAAAAASQRCNVTEAQLSAHEARWFLTASTQVWKPRFCARGRRGRADGGNGVGSCHERRSESIVSASLGCAAGFEGPRRVDVHVRACVCVRVHVHVHVHVCICVCVAAAGCRVF